MANMTLAQFETWLRGVVGNPSTADVPNTTLDQCINEAYDEIANRFQFHLVRKIVTFLTGAPTVAVPPVGTPRYPIPCDLLEARSLWNMGSAINIDAQYKLEKRDEAWLAGQQSDLNNPIFGQPTSYVRQRDWIELSPVPDGIYNMRLEYKASIAPLSISTDSPILPDVWHKGICYLARVKYWDEVQLDNPKAAAAMAIWNAWIETKPVEVQEEDFADNTEGIVVPTLSNRGRNSSSRFWSSNYFDVAD